jgi:hypothetical protein
MRALILGTALLLAGTLAQAQEGPVGTRLYRRGYHNITEAGLLLGHVNVGGNRLTSRTAVTLSSFNGYRLRQALAVGLTVGADWYATRILLPVSLGLRGDLTRGKRTALTYSLDAGKGLTWAMSRDGFSDLRGGLHLNPMLGIRLRSRNGTDFVWSAGYKHQYVQTELATGFGEKVVHDYRYNRFVFRAGMSF